jgi:hypothetical protein
MSSAEAIRLAEGEAGLVCDRGPQPRQDPRRVLARHTLELVLVEDGPVALDVGVPGPVGCVVLIGVEAAAGLPTEPAGGDHAFVYWSRAPARLAEGLVPEGAGDRKVHVDPDQVHELEGPHP